MYSESRKVTHTCSVCDLKFKSSGNLKAHTRIHTGERPYCCNICGQFFTRTSSLKRHRLLHEISRVNGKVILETKAANLPVSSNLSNQNVKDFVRTSLDESHNHSTGELTFIKEENENTEERTINQGSCLTQESQFNREERSSKHVGLATEELDESAGSHSLGNDTSENLLQGNNFSEMDHDQQACEDSEQDTTASQNIMTVVKNKSRRLIFNEWTDKQTIQLYQANVILDLEKNSATQKTLEGLTLVPRNKSESRKGIYTCSACDRKFKYSGNLKTHIRTHTGERPYCCSICDKSFTRISSLKRHRRLHETGLSKKKVILETKGTNSSGNLPVPFKFGNHNSKGSSRTSLDAPHSQSTCDPAVKETENDNSEEQTNFQGRGHFVKILCNQKKHSADLDELAGGVSECIQHKNAFDLENTMAVIKKCSSDHSCESEEKRLNDTKVAEDAEKSATNELPTSVGNCKRTIYSESGKKVYLYTCNVCDRNFKGLGNLKAHIRTHTGERPFRCSICEKSFTRMSNLKRHSLVHKKYPVNERNIAEKRTFKIAAQLQMPCIFSNQNVKDTLNTCSGESDNQPINRAALKGKFNMPSEEQADFKGVDLTKETIYDGTFCDKLGIENSKHKLSYVRKKIKQINTCEICGRKDFKRLSIHMLIHKNKSHPCPACGKLFQRKGDVTKHMSTHAKQKPYACEICGKQVVQMDTLRNHMLTHTNEKHFTCETCGKRFMWKTSLLKHRDHHVLSKELQFTCDLCNKSFTNKGRLSVHIRDTHFREKAFPCHFCNEAFKYRSKLNHHMTIHTGEKPHECGICKKRFRESEGLKAHLFRHSGQQPFSCKQCNKRFNRKENLRTHMLIHDGKKPHSCPICGKNFRQKGTVKLHIMRVHDTSR